MSKIAKEYNINYKNINGVKAEITQTDPNHTNMKTAKFILDIQIPVKKKRITLVELVEKVDKIDGILQKVVDILNDHSIRLSNIETDINNIVRLNNLKR